MLTYDMEKRGEESLYAHLYRCIKADIEAGTIAAGERLPSKRAFAEHLGVSVITVEGAYAQLCAEGYVHARQRSGYYACALPDVEARAVRAQPAGQGYADVRRSTLAVSATLAFQKDEREPGNSATGFSGEDVCATRGTNGVIADFTDGRLGNAQATANLWGKALRAAMNEEPPAELFCDLPAAGHPRLQRAIAKHLRTFRGMEVNPSCIVIGAGAQLFYVLVAQLALACGGLLPHTGHLPKGRTSIAVEDPGFRRIGRAYAATGLQVHYVPLDAQGICMDALEQAAPQVVHVMPSHQYPTGIVTSATRRYELLGWAAAQEGRFIVEDDYDCEFRLSGMPVPSLASIDAYGKVFYLNTFSKSLSSALRVAYLVLPAAVMERFEEQFGFYAGTVSSLDQIVLARLIELGDYERHINRVRTKHRVVRDALVGELAASPVAGHLSFHDIDAGLHFVLEVESSASAEDIAVAARTEGIILAPLSRWCVNPANFVQDNPTFVMNYGNMDAQQAQHAATVLAKVLARR